MSRQTTIILQKTFIDRGINKKIEMCYNFYSRWGYGAYLFRDIEFVIRFTKKLPTDFFMIKDYGNVVCDYDIGYDIAPESYRITEGGGKGATKRIYLDSQEIKKEESTKHLVHRFRKHFDSFFEFGDNVKLVGSWPCLQELQIDIHPKSFSQVYIENYIADYRKETDLFRYYFKQYLNDEGGALITMVDNNYEIRLVNDAGKFVSPKQYMRPYIKGENCDVAMKGKKVAEAYMKIIELMHNGEFIKENTNEKVICDYI